MHITVLEAEGVPEHTFLSLRVGETKRLRPFRQGESFNFHKGADNDGFIQLDAFQKLGSQMMGSGTSEGREEKCEAKEMVKQVSIPLPNGGPAISVRLKVAHTEAQPAAEKREKAPIRHKLALDAKNYLDCHDVWGVIQGLLHVLLKLRPEDPLGFMVDYLMEIRRGTSPDKHDSTDLASGKPGDIANGFDTGAREGETVSTLVPDENSALPRSSLRGDCSSIKEDRSVRNDVTQNERSILRDALVEDDHPPGFPADHTPEEPPNLLGHENLMAGVLRSAPDMYHRLRSAVTPLGVTFALCIKPGVDDSGNRLLRSVGVVAGDEYCYETFQDLFDPVIAQLHDGFDRSSFHTVQANDDLVALDAAEVERVSRYAVSSRARTSRNVSGLRFPPACSRDERRKAEQLLLKAFASLEGDVAGQYFPLRGSESVDLAPQGMSEEQEQELDRQGSLFREPDSVVQCSAGFARAWPDARGVFVSGSRQLFIQCNDEDHFAATAAQPGGNLPEAYARLGRAMSGVETGLAGQGHAFARNDRLGYVCSCPSRLGSCLHASVVLRLPLLTDRAESLGAACKRLGFRLHRQGEPGHWEFSASGRFGASEAEIVKQVMRGCAELASMEEALGQGEAGCAKAGPMANERPSEEVSPDWASASPGLGEEACPGFPATGPLPESAPDLSGHHSVMADVLRGDPDLYGSLRCRATRMGVTLGTCIKTGVDNAGHPMFKTMGVVAGDEESYEIFADLFERVLEFRNGSWAPDAKHPTDLRLEKISTRQIDPTGRYALSATLRCSRGLRGFRFPPACDRAERKEVEMHLTKAFLGTDAADLRGTYYPLRGSSSHASRPGGMSVEEEDQLQQNGFLFQEPDSSVLLCTGAARHWPEARGVFASESQHLVAWLNEEDHLRFQSLQRGGDVRAAFGRLALALAEVEKSLAEAGLSFARSDRLGYLSACPANVGTGLHVSVMLKLPLLSAHPRFASICRDRGLRPRRGLLPAVAGVQEPGLWDVAAVGRLGVSEADLVSKIINGCADLVGFEQALERDEPLLES